MSLNQNTTQQIKKYILIYSILHLKQVLIYKMQS